MFVPQSVTLADIFLYHEGLLQCLLWSFKVCNMSLQSPCITLQSPCVLCLFSISGNVRYVLEKWNVLCQSLHILVIMKKFWNAFCKSSYWKNLLLHFVSCIVTKDLKSNFGKRTSEERHVLIESIVVNYSIYILWLLCSFIKVSNMFALNEDEMFKGRF